MTDNINEPEPEKDRDFPRFNRLRGDRYDPFQYPHPLTQTDEPAAAVQPIHCVLSIGL